MGILHRGSWRTVVIMVAMLSLISACSTTDAVKWVNETKTAEEAMTSEQQSQTKEANKEEQGKQSYPVQKGEEVTANVASPLLKKGETVTYNFPNEGVYYIHCDPHPVMKMKITVQADAPSTEKLELDIVNYEFSEKEIVISPGTSITWTNKDLAEHNVAIEIE
jgi:plastocyanin